MNRSALYIVIAVLAVAAVGLGIYVYQQQTRPGVEIRLDENGVEINGNG